MNFAVVVPARIGSTRLPRKVLRELAGKPMVQWTWQAACKSGATQVVVATDSEEVANTCRAFGAQVRLTSIDHQSGTDRAAEVAQLEQWPDHTIVVNLQGDEPLMPPELLRKTAQLLEQDSGADIATLAHPLKTREEWLNPNIVKLVRNAQGRALYFSRAPIPWRREGITREPPLPDGRLAVRHMGLYAYRVGALKRFAALPPSALERCEALEQLRALENGMAIAIGLLQNAPPHGVDTEKDLALATAQLTASG